MQTLQGDFEVSPDAHDASYQVIHGARNIYTAFADVVDYSLPYQGLRRLVGRGNESAGRVVKRHAGKGLLDPHLADAFSQVGGIWVNCMTESDPGDMFIATGFEKWMLSPELVGTNSADISPSETWDVLARHERMADEKGFVSDIFVFDAASSKLTEVILGVNYFRVKKASMAKTLVRATPGLSSSPAASSSVSASAAVANGVFANDVAHSTVEMRNQDVMDNLQSNVDNKAKMAANQDLENAAKKFTEVEEMIRKHPG